MPRHHCRTPGCGRFVSAEGDTCARHSDRLATTPLDTEIAAIRKILGEALRIKDVETKAKLIPRIISVSIQAIKTEHQLGNRESDELLQLLQEVERDIETLPDRHPER